MKCVMCGKSFEEDICEICFSVLGDKYPNKINLQEVIKWHREHMKEMQEEQDGE